MFCLIEIILGKKWWTYYAKIAAKLKRKKSVKLSTKPKTFINQLAMPSSFLLA